MELDKNFKVDMPLRQGDLIGFWDWNTRGPFDRFGVIITADCDIAHLRPDQPLLYLRIIRQMDYLELVWARRKLHKLRSDKLASACARVNRLRREANNSSHDLSIDEVSTWFGGNPADVVIAEVQAHRKKDVDGIRDDHAMINAIHAAINRPPETRLIQDCAQFSCIDPSKVLARAEQELTKLPDEVFFITGFTSDDDEDGYYILLDHIGAVSPPEISNSISEVKGEAKKVYRFGTLDRVYKYAVAQQFAFLFQRIGLPDDHRDRHRQALGRAKTPFGVQGNTNG